MRNKATFLCGNRVHVMAFEISVGWLGNVTREKDVIVIEFIIELLFDSAATHLIVPQQLLTYAGSFDLSFQRLHRRNLQASTTGDPVFLNMQTCSKYKVALHLGFEWSLETAVAVSAVVLFSYC